ncbi:MAG: hypothetical protein LQ338_007782, partial [Usnochroma carphineum]
RDAFEDLLALEARGAMIRKESRMAEDRFAARNRFEYISGKISIFNSLLGDVQELEGMWQEAYQKALRDKDDQRIEVIGKKLIPSIRSDQQDRVASIQQDRAEYERNRHSTASSLKPYGQWIASLMDSGALPSWKWSVIISVDGPVMSFGKRDAPPELDAGITCSEFELEEQFQQGQPHDFGTPTLLTRMHVKPLIDKRDSITEKDAANDPFRKFRPSKSSILAQTTDTETIELPDGSVGSKVLLENYLADGTSVVKEFVQEPEKLLEEIENARKSMAMMTSAFWDMSGSGSQTGQVVREWMDQEKAVSLKLQEV